MNEFLYSIPVYWGKILAVLFFIAMAVFALKLPKKFIMQGSPDNERWRDLRLWAVVLMASQIIIYLIF